MTLPWLRSVSERPFKYCIGQQGTFWVIKVRSTSLDRWPVLLFSCRHTDYKVASPALRAVGKHCLQEMNSGHRCVCVWENVFSIFMYDYLWFRTGDWWSPYAPILSALGGVELLSSPLSLAPASVVPRIHQEGGCWTISNITAGNRAQIQVHHDPHSTSATQRHHSQGLACFIMCGRVTRLRPQTFEGVNLFVVSTPDLFLDLRMTLIFCSFSYLSPSSSAGRNRFEHLPSLDRYPYRKQNSRTRKEATWAITNATSGGTPEQIRWVLSVGFQMACFKHLKHSYFWLKCHQRTAVSFAITLWIQVIDMKLIWRAKCQNMQIQ